jgi:catechol 2,3-dioxygenase-like lactoylglutathione lyase family enzyme
MELGAFSVSLAVRDIEASKLFYEKLGFTVFEGDQSQNWLIMKNGDHTIGLFQGGVTPLSWTVERWGPQAAAAPFLSKLTGDS